MNEITDLCTEDETPVYLGQKFRRYATDEVRMSHRAQVHSQMTSIADTREDSDV